MKPQSILTKLLSTLALAFLLSIYAPPSAQAMPRSCGGCGMFGVARGQVVRINAAHIGNPDTRPIQVEMALVDATGAVVARDSQTVPPGQAVFFDVPYETLGGGEDRIELRAMISVDHERNLRSSIEVYDADTGKTTVYGPEPHIVPNPE